MRESGRASRVGASMVVLLAAAGCGSDDSAVCVTNDVGEVCADGSDGSIVFNGSGLEPGSDVSIDHPELPSEYRVEPDGTFDPGGMGLLVLFVGTEFTFIVSAIDANGDALDGEIVVATS